MWTACYLQKQMELVIQHPECTEHGMFDEFLQAALGWKWE
jgi:hypothetical protein